MIPYPQRYYGTVLHTTDFVTQRWMLGELGTVSYTDGTDGVMFLPDGHEKMIAITSLPGPDEDEIKSIARNVPGAVWAIAYEPNRRGDAYSALATVGELDRLYSAIKAEDPTARVTSPPVLNWDFTCIGCPGFTRGSDWIAEFRSAFVTFLGKEPPVDIWAINVYPLVWAENLLPTVDTSIPIDQVQGLSDYLDAEYPGQDKPIWITEMSLHWGYDEIDFNPPGCLGRAPAPKGTYQTQQVIDYLTTVYDWLEANAASLNVERWFQYITYRDIHTCNGDGYAGVSLFDGPDIGANLTEVGEFFRDRVKVP